MIEPLDQAYTQMGRQLDAFVAPVGRAWAASLKANPDISLYDDDGSHPNVYGTYLTACVFYATLTGLTPVGLGDADLKQITPQQRWLCRKQHGKPFGNMFENSPSKRRKNKKAGMCCPGFERKSSYYSCGRSSGANILNTQVTVNHAIRLAAGRTIP